MISYKHHALFFMFIFSNHLLYTEVICTSIPKCGTHLLSKLLTLLDLNHAGICHHDNYLRLNDNKIANIPVNHFMISHAICNIENINIIKQFNHKVIFIYRDPRDQIISFINYMKIIRPNRWVLENLSQEELISLLIEDYSLIYNTYKPSLWNNPLLLTIGNINNFYSLFLPWIQHPFVYTTTFEKLVGKEGGGSSECQLREIRNICNFLEINKTDNDIRLIAKNLFGNKSTFFKGQIGKWKVCFSDAQKKRFKEVAGQLLIDLGYETDLNW